MFMGETIVPVRMLLLIGIVAAMTGCANETAPTPFGLQSGLASTAKASMLGGPAVAAVQEADLKRAAKQTLSAKMLAAIALQRVTGRTADPSRFSELRAN
jgi:hypothetical protein